MAFNEMLKLYAAPPWLPGGHLQTIWPTLWPRPTEERLQYRRTRWTTLDSDFIDVDWLDSATLDQQKQPLLVLFHGLEGNSGSHYARAFADYARHKSWAYAVPHFRGCSGEINLAPRAYHSGDHVEINWILQRLRAERTGPIVAIGVSLGGNALVRWAQEAGYSAAKVVSAITAICAPLDLAAGGWALGRGFNRLAYTRMFLRTMKPKAMLKLQQHPGLFDSKVLADARDLYAFDNVFTAPLHGFKNTDDYWARASAIPHLQEICIPTLLINPRNDPFVPLWSLPAQRDESQYVKLWQPFQGGHVGFPAHTGSAREAYLPQEVGSWLKKFIE
jgi:predicted alpha/beta-fold hydrolase